MRILGDYAVSCKDRVELSVAILAAQQKLQRYYDCASIMETIGIVLDPRWKMGFLEKVWALTPKWIDGARNSLIQALEVYAQRYENAQPAIQQVKERNLETSEADEMRRKKDVMYDATSLSTTNTSELDEY